MNILKKGRTTEVTAVFNSSIKAVWDVVTSNSNYSWRSDIKRIEVLENGKEFIEYPYKGNETKFIIINKKEYSNYKFNMVNKMFTGACTGQFLETETGGTILILKEAIFIENPFLEVFSHLFLDLKKIQNTYISDLKKQLSE